MKTLTIGISSCPNDTFTFHGLLSKAITIPGYELKFVIADIAELNQLLCKGEIDVTKASFHAALLHAKNYGVLPVGAALGEGVGPLMVTHEASRSPDATSTILCPGPLTTATLLTKLFYPESTQLKHRIFSDIQPAVQNAEVPFGVLIHEGRFTYSDHGLHLVADLGEKWHSTTGSLLPLGGLFAKQSLGQQLHDTLTQAIRESIHYGYEHKEEALTTMQYYAQELEAEHLWPHVELYVNQQTLSLTEQGRDALVKLHELASSRGVVGSEASALEVLGS